MNTVTGSPPTGRPCGRSGWLFGVIGNLFDRYPPFTGYEFQTARQLYDVIGRQYTAGCRFRFRGLTLPAWAVSRRPASVPASVQSGPR